MSRAKRQIFLMGYLEAPNGTEDFLPVDLASQGATARLYEARRAAAIARLTLKRVGIGFDHIEQQRIAILMLET